MKNLYSFFHQTKAAWLLTTFFSVWGHNLGASKPTSALNLENFQKDVAYNAKETWKNNPFLKSIENNKAETLKLFGIVRNDEAAFALINRQVVQAKDFVGENEVIEIKTSFVVLQNKNGLFKLTFEGSTQ